MHDRNARATQGYFQSKIEVGSIHADETQRRIGQQLVANRPARRQDFPQRTEHLHIAIDGKRLHRPVGDKALRHHAAAADTREVHGLAQPRMQPFKQKRSQQIAGSLPGDHGNRATLVDIPPSDGRRIGLHCGVDHVRRGLADDAALRRGQEFHEGAQRRAGGYIGLAQEGRDLVARLVETQV